MAAGKPLLLVSLILALSVVIHAGPLIPDGIKCGQLTCKKNEYCSEIENQCASCSTICDQKLHNYDAALCMESCQGEAFSGMDLCEQGLMCKSLDVLGLNQLWNIEYTFIRFFGYEKLSNYPTTQKVTILIQ